MSLTKKLLIKPGQRISILNAPPGYLDLLGDLPEGVSLVERPEPGSLDLLHLFAGSVAELERLAPEALPLIKYDALLWISYPKKSGTIKTDITRDIGWNVVKEAGLQPVTQVALDETWSALRFRPSDRVGK